jgi:hypothetical protein
MAFTTLDVLRHEKHRFPSIGRCIYCGVRGQTLTDEHIIPFSLTGNAIIFEKASCTECQKLINQFEQPCLRKMFGAFRVQADLPTRRRKERPSAFELVFSKVDDQGLLIGDPLKRNIPANQVPLSLSSWRLPLPAILCGRTPSDDIIGEAWCHVNDVTARRLINEVRKQIGYTGHLALKIADIPKAHFLRFLAKIAHTYAVAEHGYDAFEHLATPVILGRSNALCDVVGGEWAIPPRSTGAEIVDIKLGQCEAPGGMLIAGVRLFPFMGTPQHIVVVGRFREGDLAFR